MAGELGIIPGPEVEMAIVRWILIVVVVALVSAGVWLRSRDPERLALDDVARRQAPGQFMALGAGTTHYEVRGPEDGPRVVLVHGFSVPSYIWDSTMVALTAAGFRVARYDTYGRGYSDRPDVAYDLALFDRQLVELLDGLGWRDAVHLVGLSFGGPVTATFVANRPQRVRTWTLVDPAAGPSGALPAMFALPVVGPMLWQGLAVPGMAPGQLTDFVEPARWPDWVDRYRVQQQYRGFGRALYRTRLAMVGTSTDSLYARAGATGIPSLLLWGTEDRTVPIERAEGVRRAIPQVEYHAVERAGHLPHMERTDVVNPLLVEFLRR